MTRPATFTPADAARLDRGWPFCITLSDDPADNRKPDAAALKWVESIDPKRSVVWPRALAERVAGIGPVTQFRKVAHAGQAITARTQRGIDPTRPALDPSALCDALRADVAESHESYAFKVFDVCFAHEALLGVEVALAALLDGLDALDVARPRTYLGTPLDFYAKRTFVSAAALMALRASDALRARTRATLTSLMQRIEAHIEARGRATPVLSWTMVSHRAAWAAFGADAPSHCRGLEGDDALLDDLLFAPVDPAVVAMRATQNATWPISVRHAWLGGREALRGLHARKPRAVEAPWFLRDFGVLREPEVVDLMAVSLAKPKLAPIAGAWLSAHRDFAAPCLAARVAEGGALAAAATAALAQ